MRLGSNERRLKDRNAAPCRYISCHRADRRLLGFTGIAAGAVEIARILFLIFLLLFVVLVIGLMRRPR